MFSKYIDKGNAVEVESLAFISKELDIPSLVKNEESFENGFLTGTPDAILDEYIIDVKNSWDCFSFLYTIVVYLTKTITGKLRATWH